MESRRIVLPGGSGFIGNYVSWYFSTRGYEVVVLSRGKSGFVKNIRYVSWDACSMGDWAKYIDGAFAVINLTGRSVNCRFTRKNKKEIIESRVSSVKVLLQACHQAVLPPVVFLQTSSIGFYGNTSVLCTEDSPAGSDFLAKVCSVWEDAFFGLPLLSTRKVILRFGVVMGNRGGALMRMIPWVRWYLGGQLGNGKQPVSWIHLEDLTRMLEFAINHSDLNGCCNATSPYPLTNAQFMASLRQVTGKPWAPPVPAFVVRLTAFLFMRTDAWVLLRGAACLPRRFQDLGFEFKYPRLPEALRHLLFSSESL
ncbi:MAG: TIGR01777 family oxidoreductase [Bacteroidales bacterium]|nr:TIGR01777 family oxidoreductase [Bacteroidales bacterium]